MNDLVKMGWVEEINSKLNNGIKKKEYVLTFEGSWKINGIIKDFDILSNRMKDDYKK